MSTPSWLIPLAISTEKQGHYAPFATGAAIADGILYTSAPWGYYPAYLDGEGREVGRAPDSWHVHFGLDNENRIQAELVIVGGHGESHRLRIASCEPHEGGFDLARAIAELDQAALPGMVETYHAERARWLAGLETLKGLSIASFEDYLAACRAMVVPARDEESISTWGVFGYPEYPVDTCLERMAAQRLAYRREREATEAAEAARRERAESRDEAIEALREAPVSETRTMVLPGGSPREWLTADGRLAVVVSSRPVTIDADMPSRFGSHLLGHEGERGIEAQVEVRGIG